jgi:hypothetical protein
MIDSEHPFGRSYGWFIALESPLGLALEDKYPQVLGERQGAVKLASASEIHGRV